jgi:hypothetical protein
MAVIYPNTKNRLTSYVHWLRILFKAELILRQQRAGLSEELAPAMRTKIHLARRNRDGRPRRDCSGGYYEKHKCDRVLHFLKPNRTSRIQRLPSKNRSVIRSLTNLTATLQAPFFHGHCNSSDLTRTKSCQIQNPKSATTFFPNPATCAGSAGRAK